MLKDLISLANHLDQKGLKKESDVLDSLIKRVAQSRLFRARSVVGDESDPHAKNYPFEHVSRVMSGDDPLPSFFELPPPGTGPKLRGEIPNNLPDSVQGYLNLLKEIYELSPKAMKEAESMTQESDITDMMGQVQGIIADLWGGLTNIK